ncbi:hypothetical protein LJC47_08220, partial [Desulfosarcina sp. OttesenSCG-928-B08]|nr:hypothetical protein [Desulfosarcina sp. OttesenSCG-928-B08]
DLGEIEQMIQNLLNEGINPVTHYLMYGIGWTPTDPVTNTPPVITGIPTQATQLSVGDTINLADFTVFDADGDELTVTLTAVNGSLGGVEDADPSTPGIQLKGSAHNINIALKNLTFTATQAGNASVGIRVTDGKAITTATYNLFTPTATDQEPPTGPTNPDPDPTEPSIPATNSPPEVVIDSTEEQHLRLSAGQAVTLPTITVKDGNNDLLTVALDAMNGEFFVTGDGWYTSKTWSACSVGEINGILTGLQFRATGIGDASITVTANDGKAPNAKVTCNLCCTCSLICGSEPLTLTIDGTITFDTSLTVDSNGSITVVEDSRTKLLTSVLAQDMALDVSGVTTNDAAKVTIDTSAFPSAHSIIAPEEISTTIIPGNATLVQGGKQSDNIIVKNGSFVTDINGGESDDTITVETGGWVLGGTIKGGEGNDTIAVAGRTTGIYGGKGADTITVEIGGDVLFINGGEGADEIYLNGQSTTIEIGKGHTDGYTNPAAGATFNLTGIDQIHKPGSGTILDLGGGWAAAGVQMTASAIFVDVTDNTIQVIQGTVTDNNFSANAGGNDALIVYDADLGVGAGKISPQAVVLVGVDSGYEFFATNGGVEIKSAPPVP